MWQFMFYVLLVHICECSICSFCSITSCYFYLLYLKGRQNRLTNCEADYDKHKGDSQKRTCYRYYPCEVNWFHNTRLATNELCASIDHNSWIKNNIRDRYILYTLNNVIIQRSSRGASYTPGASNVKEKKLTFFGPSRLMHYTSLYDH